MTIHPQSCSTLLCSETNPLQITFQSRKVKDAISLFSPPPCQCHECAAVFIPPPPPPSATEVCCRREPTCSAGMRLYCKATCLYYCNAHYKDRIKANTVVRRAVKNFLVLKATFQDPAATLPRVPAALPVPTPPALPETLPQPQPVPSTPHGKGSARHQCAVCGPQEWDVYTMWSSFKSTWLCEGHFNARD